MKDYCIISRNSTPACIELNAPRISTHWVTKELQIWISRLPYSSGIACAFFFNFFFFFILSVKEKQDSEGGGPLDLGGV